MVTVQVKQRIDLLANRRLIDNPYEDAVGSELMVVDPPAEKRSLSVGEPQRTDHPKCSWPFDAREANGAFSQADEPVEARPGQ